VGVFSSGKGVEHESGLFEGRPFGGGETERGGVNLRLDGLSSKRTSPSSTDLLYFFLQALHFSNFLTASES